jgi:hypothetical protein
MVYHLLEGHFVCTNVGQKESDVKVTDVEDSITLFAASYVLARAHRGFGEFEIAARKRL